MRKKNSGFSGLTWLLLPFLPFMLIGAFLEGAGYKKQEEREGNNGII